MIDSDWLNLDFIFLMLMVQADLNWFEYYKVKDKFSYIHF